MIDSKIYETMRIFNDNTVYEIPDFQRDFVWGRDEIEQLFSDFSEDTNEHTAEVQDLDGYLLGNIVLIKDSLHSSKMIVVDGQQRLTTLSLLYKALDKIISKKIQGSATNLEHVEEWADIKSGLNKGYGIYNNFKKLESLKITHDPSLKFGSSYKKIIKEEVNDSEEFDFDSSSNTKIFEVFDAINEKLSDLEDPQLKQFVSYLKNQVFLIVTIAPNISKAFQLFEILNNRGKGLEPLDLIKNTLLKNIESDDLNSSERKDFNKNWSAFINNLEITNKKKVESSTFLKHYVIGNEGINVPKEKLYEHYVRLTKDYQTQDILKLVTNFKRVSKIYGDIEKQEFDSFISSRENMFILFQILKLKQIHTMLIPFYFSSDETKDKIIDLAVRFGASVIFSFTSTNFIEKSLPSIIQNYNSNKNILGSEEAFSILSGDIEALIRERATIAKEAISTRKFENTRGNYTAKGRELLQFIELYGHKNDHIITTVNSKTISLEHILPRKLGPYEPGLAEFKNAEEVKEFMNRIGNLALMKKSDNSHVSNSRFDDKKEVFAKSDFHSTKVLSGELKTHIKTGKEKILFDQINDTLLCESSLEYWTKSMIIERSRRIGEYVEAILTRSK